MITKNQSNALSPRPGYYCQGYDTSSADKITDRQLRKLTAYILSCANDSDDEKEEKINALQDLTEAEADDYLCDISRWS